MEELNILTEASYIKKMQDNKDTANFSTWPNYSFKGTPLEKVDFKEYFDFLHDIYMARGKTRYLWIDPSQQSDYIDAHHIIFRSIDASKADDLDNLIALTRSQHLNAHIKFLKCLLQDPNIDKQVLIDASGAVSILGKYSLKDDLTPEEYAELCEKIRDAKQDNYRKLRFGPKNRKGTFDGSNNQKDLWRLYWEDGSISDNLEGQSAIIKEIENRTGIAVSPDLLTRWGNGSRKSYTKYGLSRPPVNLSDPDNNRSTAAKLDRTFIAFEWPYLSDEINFNEYKIGYSERQLKDKIGAQRDLAVKAEENHDKMEKGKLPTVTFSQTTPNTPNWLIIFADDLELLKYVLTQKNMPFDSYTKIKQELNLKEALLEDSRAALVNKSRNVGQYVDQTHGKNRFERKRLSKIANAVKAYNKIDMNKLFKEDTLVVNIPVIGETDQYTVTIKMEGVVSEIARNLKNNNNKLEYKTILQALTKVFNTANVYVKCTCDDYKYRFAHWNIINNVSVDDTASDPGPGKGIRNPNDDKGRGCKHILLVLANGDWLLKVASVINNYIHYAEENLQKPFLKVIFPKLYGIPAEEMVEQDLIDDDKYLDSSTGLIDAINEYGKQRGRYKKGSNKNPVTGTGGPKKKEAESEENEEEAK